MDSESFGLIGWSYACAGVAYAGCAIFLWTRGRAWRAIPAARFVLIAVAASAAWGMLGVGFAMTGSPKAVSGGFVADVLRYAAWHAFSLALLGAGRPDAGDPARVLRPIAAVLAATGLLVHGAILAGVSGLTGIASLHMLCMIVFALLLLEQIFRNASTDSQWSVKPLCVGLGGALAFDLFLFSDTVLFRQLDVDAYAVRGLVHASVSPLLMLSTVRARNWVARMRLSQKAVFHSATLTITGGYLLFMAAVGYYVRSFGGNWGRALQIAILFAAALGLAIVLLSGSVRAKLRVFVGKHFFRYRYDYREEWLRFTQTLSAQDVASTVGEQVVRGLADLVESPSGVLWVKDQTRPVYLQLSRWNMPACDAEEPAGSSLTRFLIDSGWVINLEEFRSFPARYKDLDLPAWLPTIPNAWLIVPLMTGGEMIGFAILGSSRTAIDVNWEVNDLLRTAGRQAASYLAQMRATEALLEVQKFDAFNRMSAFVVHDLKNIVTQLSLMLKNAERHQDKPEFRRDMLTTVNHSVERMRQLMLQLREGATPPGTPVGVDLAAIIERIAQSKAVQGRSVEIRIAERLMTRGQEERIERVIGHLVQNALDATDAGGRTWVVLARDGGLASIEVGDTGHGMAPEFVRERLFKPFQTTKQAGMGIGAYESFQYVQELGGKVDVESKLNEGTRIRILLPMFAPGTRPDLRERETA
ncbi:MAG: PEP-CTERM system histidine kinase PrsK [Delftia acidovorans]|nr:PEP-CTERM system histidine kinase PrsK [Delftia acidovorans]